MFLLRREQKPQEGNFGSAVHAKRKIENKGILNICNMVLI